MSYKIWRGVVGVVQPSTRPGSLEEYIRLLPDGIGVIPVFLGVKEGTVKEFVDAMEPIKEKVAELARHKVDLIFPAGAPVFMVRGYEGEGKIVRALEEKHGIPVVTSGMSQVEALNALGVKRIVVLTYFLDETNRDTARYFNEAGFEVLAVETISTWADAGRLSPREIYVFAKKLFLKNKNVEGIVISGHGGGWGGVDAAQILEQDLQIPVVTNTSCKVWATQKRLFVRQPVKGYGRLLEQMP